MRRFTPMMAIVGLCSMATPGLAETCDCRIVSGVRLIDGQEAHYLESLSDAVKILSVPGEPASLSEGILNYEERGPFPRKSAYMNVTTGKIIARGLSIGTPFSEGRAAVQIGKEHKFGFIDTDGTLVIEPEYLGDGIPHFQEGLAAVRLKEKFGFIDRNGKLEIAARFDRASSFRNGLAIVNVHGQFGYIDKGGKFLIEPQFQAAWPFEDELAVASDLKGRRGYIDKSGRFVIKPQFSNARPFSDGLAAVDAGYDLAHKWGFIDRTGKVVVETKHQEVGTFSSGIAQVKLNGEWYTIDKIGSRIPQPDVFSKAFRRLMEEHPELFQENGKAMVRPTVEQAADQLAVIRVGKNFGLINSAGSLVIEPKFNYIFIYENRSILIRLITNPEVASSYYLVRLPECVERL